MNENNSKYDLCPDFTELEQLQQGQVPEPRASQLMEHIRQCADCRDVYEALNEYGTSFTSQIEDQINSRIDARVESVSKTMTGNGRIIKMVAKYAAAASIVGLGVWGVVRMGAGSSSGFDNADFSAVEASAVVPLKTATEDITQESSTSDDGNSEDLYLSAPEKKQTATPATKTEPAAPVQSQADKPKTKSEPVAEPVEEVSDQGVVLSRGLSVTPSVPKADNPELLQKIADGKALIDSGQYEKAKEIFEDIVDHNPRNSAALKNLGICNMNLGLKRRAIDNFKHVTPANDAEAQEIQQLIDKCKE